MHKNRFFLSLFLVLMLFQSIPPSKGLASSNPKFANASQTPHFQGKIAFFGADNNIWVLEGETGQLVQITKDGLKPNYNADYHSISNHFPTWSPDGNILVFCRRESTASEENESVSIFNYTLKKTIGTLQDATCPVSWAKDGKTFAFAKPAVPSIMNSGFAWENPQGIWSYDTEKGSFSELVAPFSDYPLAYPEWSLDGQFLMFRQIAYFEGAGLLTVWDKSTGEIYQNFQGQQDRAGSAVWAASNLIIFDEVTYVTSSETAIFSSNPDGSGTKKLLSLNGKSLTSPTASPDGELIAISSTVPDDYISAGDIAVTDLKGENIRVFSGGSPISWSPDGKQILYQGPENTLWILDIQTQRQVQIPSASAFAPSWSGTQKSVDITPLIDEKRELINQLENLTVDTGFLSIPAFGGLNETRPRNW